MSSTLEAGAGAVDISPVDSQFLYGYPHVERHSTGIHDPLMSSALCLGDGRNRVLIIANDIIFVPKDLGARARARIAESTGVPESNIMLTATHTHSGPMTMANLSCQADKVVPQPDPAYVQLFEEGIVAAAEKACADIRPAVWGRAIGDSTGIGTNRRDPSGPADHQMPVVIVRDAEDNSPIALMYVCSMHPTVLHEDSKLVSADFPGMTRQYLQEHVVGADCPVLHHTGPAGNQSPRHVTRGNTFDEAKRLGRQLARAIEEAVKSAEYESEVSLKCRQAEVALPLREFPSVPEAEAKLDRTFKRLEHLRASGAPRTETRTAECDWFGAQETLTLSKAAVSGELEAVAATCLPAEVQSIRIGPWTFVGWPGECFVEFPLQVKERCDDTFVISLANGDTQGYMVTAEAVEEGGYEASNSMFRNPDSGDLLVETTLRLLPDNPEA